MDILLVDDHALFREGLSLVLQQLDDANIFEAENAASALSIIDQQPNLDLVLLDLNLPDNNDFSLLQSVRTKLPATPVTMLSATEDAGLIQQALQLGASGFITKTSSSQVMLQAINLILAGGLYLPPQMLQKTQDIPETQGAETIPTETSAATTVSNKAESDLYFTERQMDVLRLLDQGMSNKEIARDLDMSPSTVKVHVAAILRECEASNRTQAVSMLRQAGIIG